jgi:hypothetical protein
MAIFEWIVGSTKHFRVCGNQPKWVELIHKNKVALEKNSPFALWANNLKFW